MGKHCGSLWCWRTPEVIVSGQGQVGRCEWVSPGCCPQRGEAVVLFYLSLSCTSFTPLPADGTQPGRLSEMQQHWQEGSRGSWSRDKHCFAQHRPACMAPPNPPGCPTAYKAHGKVLPALRVRDVEAERGVEVQEVGSRGGEHPYSLELPGGQVGSSLWFSSSLDTGVGQPALEQAERLEKSWVL